MDLTRIDGMDDFTALKVISEKRSWQLVYGILRDADGKHQQRYETVQGTRRQSKVRLADMLRAEYHAVTNLTVSEYLNLWLTDYVAVRARPHTLSGYWDIAESDITPACGHIHLSALTAWQIDRFYSGKIKEDRSACTVTHYHRLLRQALGQAVIVGDTALKRQQRLTAPGQAQAPVPDPNCRLDRSDSRLPEMGACRLRRLPVVVWVPAGSLGGPVGIGWRYRKRHSQPRRLRMPMDVPDDPQRRRRHNESDAGLPWPNCPPLDHIAVLIAGSLQLKWAILLEFLLNFFGLGW